MGKEWLMIFLLAFASDPVPKAEPSKTTSPVAPVGAQATGSVTSIANASGLEASPPVTQTKCDTRPYKSLVGRTISDVLTIKLPPGTRIYRLGDPVIVPIPTGRLNIEINRGTRVGRIYCS
jgi:hypothetical protein